MIVFPFATASDKEETEPVTPISAKADEKAPNGSTTDTRRSILQQAIINSSHLI